MDSALDFFVNQLTEVERSNFTNNRILAIFKNSIQSIIYKDILKKAKELESKQAQDYATFAIECDRRGMKILNFEDWIKL